MDLTATKRASVKTTQVVITSTGIVIVQMALLGCFVKRDVLKDYMDSIVSFLVNV